MKLAHYLLLINQNPTLPIPLECFEQAIERQKMPLDVQRKGSEFLHLVKDLVLTLFVNELNPQVSIRTVFYFLFSIIRHNFNFK